MRIIHWLLGRIILLLNWIFTPRSFKRDAVSQAKIDAETKLLALYQYKACPFCVKVRRAIKRQGLSIQTRDAKRSEDARNDLVENGGRLKVPCLKIEHADGTSSWMYESSDIIAYLNGRFMAQ
jgi:glutaredoxin